ncbi:recombinase family protein [Rubinisphaera margarita]|uniref:recombinase family protein n=1 Tax=Rubinisphaera margarita TaxID=2909586 RepID=UPI001EE83F7D|nr:recombinase family protein [Rubinisphaera margarita]MCG6157706.1 recombinase family protein [Rubinisphaera margarita]
MLNRIFDPFKPLLVVLYLRMSSGKQNPRSPDQQEAEIRQRITALGYPWKIVGVYRDDAQSGRYTRKRAGYQKMLRDIRSGKVPADMILVDTLQRLGRNEDLGPTRKDLREQYGVLVLTADSHFADPTTPQGKAFGAFEEFRATEENRIKAHQVLRGKRDLARRGFWPGGAPPFGYRLVSKIAESDGRQYMEGSVLEPLPEESLVIQKLFERAKATGHGSARLAQHLNADPEIPEKFKPFHDATVRMWLKQEIYCGDLVWGKEATDVVSDTRVKEPNPESEWLRVPNFCPPIIERDVWEEVALVRLRRKRANDNKSTGNGKQIRPLAPGVSLTYPLSGLVQCAECKSAMRPITSGRSSNGGRTYAYYACPRAITGGGCSNKTYFPERWLFETVVDHLASRLFPADV